MLISKKMLDSFLDQILNSESYDSEQLFVIMKYAYSKEELEKEIYSIEVCAPYYDRVDNKDCYMWFNDWYEGQNYIELLGIFGESHMLEMIFNNYNYDAEHPDN